MATASATSAAALVESAKKAAAYQAVEDYLLPSAKYVGIGSGSTVVYVVEAIASKGHAFYGNMTFIPTGSQSKGLIRQAGLTLCNLDERPVVNGQLVALDVAFDGADEVDDDLNLIKGGGACLFQEKLVAVAAKKFVAVADYRKQSPRLCTKWKTIPIEVLPLAAPDVLSRLSAMGSPSAAVRAGLPSKAGECVTDNGMWIIDAPFSPLLLPKDLASGEADGTGKAGAWEVKTLADELLRIPGIVEIGLFYGLNGVQAANLGNGSQAQKPVAAYFGMADDLGPDAHILFASDSISEILGYQPHEVQDKSSFDFFHPDEVPFARSIHSRGILLDKAAVLHYARLRSRSGQWVSCECCFTIVHDVLVACISIYQQGEKSQRRAIEAPQIRRLFSCSPKDPRYHMLQHLSPKFELPPAHREPRAALILNRFTRSLSIMFSTNAIASILGLQPEDVQNKSFYECIQESCLEDAVKCLEGAKANDSIAYLRFWTRDPRREEDLEDGEDSESEAEGEPILDGVQPEPELNGPSIKEEPVSNGVSDGARPNQHRSHDSLLSDSDSGGVRLDDEMDLDSDGHSSPRVKVEDETDGLGGITDESGQTSDGAVLPESSRRGTQTRDENIAADETGSRAAQPNGDRRQPRYPLPSIEIEAVVSCTSDGLVVILRKARPPIPTVNPSPISVTPRQGVFAAPWAQQPIRPQYGAEAYNNPQASQGLQTTPLRGAVRTVNGPPLDYLMESIREVAVFAWALVGINGNLASYSRGRPMAGAQPSGGLPIWDPNAGPTTFQGPENQAVSRWAAFENGQGSGFFHPGMGSRKTSAPWSASEMSKMHSHEYSPNGYNHRNSNGYGDYTPNGIGNSAPNGHVNGHANGLNNGHSGAMTNGHNWNDSITNGYSHNGPVTNGHRLNGHINHFSDGLNGHLTNGFGNYTLDANTQSTPSTQLDGTSANGHGRWDASSGQGVNHTNGHGRGNPSSESSWNSFTGTQPDGVPDGIPASRNNTNRWPNGWA
ncbi:Ribose-5-phosphate isomerase [Paramyrothecium foliicola]|nr:Ribose-5-phosphate isomerase [Paramyrothecium foliicola]